MPAFNAAAYIEQSIKSVLSQSYGSFELIVIDDASVDNTLEIATALSLTDNRIKVFHNETNKGVAFSRNYGIELSKGELIAFLDSDDLWLKDKLSIQVQMKKNNPEVPLLYSAYELIDSSSKRLKKAVLPSTKIKYDDLLKSNDIGCLTVVVDRSVLDSERFEKIGHEDFNLWLKLLAKGQAAIGTNDILAQYRVHKSLSSNKRKAALWRWNIYFKEQKLGLVRSAYYFIHYALNSFQKYTALEN